jgi:pyruvate kinase
MSLFTLHHDLCRLNIQVMKTRLFHPIQEITREFIVDHLSSITREMLALETDHSDMLALLHDNYKISGTNLLHYLVLRSHEIRKTQHYLLHNGLSSLAHSEGHTLSQIERVLSWLRNEPYDESAYPCDFRTASALRLLHAEQLLGEYSRSERPHIMVTFSAEHMQQAKLVEDMLNEGMTVARINCAHDDKDVWLNMIRVLRNAIAKTGRNCKIYMDLSGPKIRIQEIIVPDNKNAKKLRIAKGDKLVLCPTVEAGRAYQHDKKLVPGILLVEPAEILPMITAGEQLYFDDGKFSARVTNATGECIEIEITRVSAKKPFIKPQKGINLPNTAITIDALTDQDKANIPFICKHADMVGFSFVNQPEDIDLLRNELRKHSGKNPPHIILKIERLSAIQNLPALLLNGMKDEAFGVMIARGDLGVEIGFERLSEIQEEILWICEAGHVPVIWATQVLESLNKEGFATRSEVSDAALSGRAECVMLNKGKYIVETIKTLNDILLRQMAHISKKRYIMRPLGIAKNYVNPTG